MTESNTQPVAAAIKLSDLGWGEQVLYVMCNRCDRSFLVPSDLNSRECPYCRNGNLDLYEGQDFSNLQCHIRPPEMQIPFNYPIEKLFEGLQTFAKEVPYAPEDLTAENLRNRLRMVYIPMWLVDGQVSATWQADCGFHYQAKSHEENFNSGRWNTRDVIETRTRWEPRLGKLTRTYQNMAAPGLNDHRKLMERLGGYNYSQSVRTDWKALISNKPQPAPVVLVPERDKEDAWPDTLPRFQEEATSETRQAAAADQIRDFRWKPTFTDQSWTLFLLPAWSSFYLDDDNVRQVLLVNGQSGQANGPRRASMKTAKQKSLTLLIAALVVLALTVGAGLLSMMVPALLLLAGIGLVLVLILALAAIHPILTVGRVNRE